MKVTVVGTSCNWFKRLNTSFVIDDNILFDVPGGNFKAILNYLDIFDIDWIFISHFHSDHIADICKITTNFIRFAKNYNRKRKLRIYGPEGTAEQIIKLNEVYCGGPDEVDIDLLKSAVDFVTVSDGMVFEESGYKIEVFKMEHGDLETYGLTFEDEKGTVVGFSADTTPCENLNKILKKSNFAFVDMAAVEKSKTHICVKEFVNIVKKFPNCKIFPIHTCDASQEYAEKNGLNFVVDGQTFNF